MVILSKKIEENCSYTVAPTDSPASEDISKLLTWFDDNENVDLSQYPSLDPNPIPESQKVYTRCPNPVNGMVFLNGVTGKELPIPCNKYQCPYCGMLKARKLYSACMEFFQPYKWIRMWTLTYSAKRSISPSEHYKILQEAWRRFITEIRRSKFLSPSQRKLSYIRVSEVHEGEHKCNSEYLNKGYIHFHILVTEFISVKLLQQLWHHIISDLTGITEKQGNINIIGIPNHKKAASYICKYVMKSCKLIEAHYKKWTKSGKIALFRKKLSSGEWILWNKSYPIEDMFMTVEVLSFYTCKSDSTTSQTIESLPPPILPISDLFEYQSKKSESYLA